MKPLLIFTFIYFNQIIIFAQNVADAESFVSQINTRMLKKDYNGAIQISNMAIRQNPENERLYYYLGAASYELKYYDSAITNYTKAIKICNNSMIFFPMTDEESEINNRFINSAYKLRGYSKFKMEDYLGAISDYDYVIVFDPYDAETYFNRGLVKLLLNQKREGCIDLSRAGELGYSKAYRQIKLYCH
jgi:tetratricopeptide (TPR) repeat protein